MDGAVLGANLAQASPVGTGVATPRTVPTTGLPSPSPTAEAPGVVLPRTVPVSVVGEANHDPALRQQQTPDRAQPICRDSVARIGSNTIESVGISSVLSFEIPAISQNADFLTQAAGFVTRNQQLFIVEEHNYRLRSMVHPYSVAGTGRAPVARSGTIFRSNVEPIEAGHITPLSIMHNGVRNIEILDPATFDRFMTGNLPNAKAVESALSGEFRSANRFLLREMGPQLAANAQRTDNSMIYAKGVCAALQLEISAACGNVVVPVAFGDVNPVSILNLDDPALTATQWVPYFAGGDIQMLQGVDYEDADLQVIHWLARPGRRLQGAARATTSHCLYIDWPAIPFLLLSHGAAAAPPEAALITARQMYGFLERLADSRNEWQDFARGVYLALEVIGVRYSVVAQRYRHLTADYNAYHVAAPTPRDYNIFLRMMHIMFKNDRERQSEVTIWLKETPQARVNVSALYSAIKSVSTTTLLTSMNITTSGLVNWGTGAGNADLQQQILSDGLCPAATRTQECIVYAKTRDMFNYYFGWTVERDLFPGWTWNGPQGCNPHAALSFVDLAQHIPPTFFNPMAADNLLLIRPLEWGVLSPEPNINLTADLVTGAAQDVQGVYARLGDHKYVERVTSAAAFEYVAYGAMLVNAVTQVMRPNVLNLQEEHAQWDYSHGSGWSAPAHFIEPEWDNELKIVRPCTMVTFNFENRRVIAPVLLHGDLGGDMGMSVLEGWTGQKIGRIGFFLSRRNMDVPLMAFRGLSLGGLGSRIAIAGPASVGPHNPGPVAQRGDGVNDGAHASTRPS